MLARRARRRRRRQIEAILAKDDDDDGLGLTYQLRCKPTANPPLPLPLSLWSQPPVALGWL